MGVSERFRRFLRRHAPSRKAAFTAIYKLDDWNARDERGAEEGSVSGPGSTLDATFGLRKVLPELIESLGIRTILDAPCGDCRWIREADLRGAAYTGADIVEALIDSNRKRLGPEDFRGAGSVEFSVLDIVEGPVPASDLILCRDCLVHLRNRDIQRAIDNFRASGSKYLLTTTFPDAESNPDLKRTGGWRPLNMALGPFGLGEADRVVREHRESGAPESSKPVESSKSMGLWLLNSEIA